MTVSSNHSRSASGGSGDGDKKTARPLTPRPALSSLPRQRKRPPPSKAPPSRPLPARPSTSPATNTETRMQTRMQTRPSVPSPLRPFSPSALRQNKPLPSPTPTSASASEAEVMDISSHVRSGSTTPKGVKPLSLPKDKSLTSRIKPITITQARPRGILMDHNRTHVRSRSEGSKKDTLPPIPVTVSPLHKTMCILDPEILSSLNGILSEGSICGLSEVDEKEVIQPDDSLIGHGASGGGAANEIEYIKPIELVEYAEHMEPETPSSAHFHSSSDASANPKLVPSSKSPKSTHPTRSPAVSAKSVRWAELPLFPEQQGLVNIHGLLKTLIESGKCEAEVNDACRLLQLHLPQAGVASERKYTLRSSQEEELEHSLRILDGALYRNLDTSAVEKAKNSLLKLAPVIQQRFATLPYHRGVQKLKTERAQLKEDRALILVQLAIQEGEIKAAHQRREAERNREIEEAALRRMKRREEKLKERETYLQYRQMLDSRSEELKEVNRKIEKENQHLLKAREERDKKNLERLQRSLNIGIHTGGGSVRVRSTRGGDGVKCWI